MTHQEPLRVLHVIGAMDRAGAETLVMNLYRKMDRSQVQFDFLVNETRTCDYDEEILGLGGRLYRIPRFMVANYLGYDRACREFFARDEHPVVHGHIALPAFIYLPLARRAGAFTILHSHAQNYPLSPAQLVFRALTHRARGRADYYLACSQQAGLDMFGSDIVAGERFRVLKNGIDARATRFSREGRARVRAELGLGEETPVLGHVGRFSAIKNHAFLISVFRRVHRRLPDAHLVLVGKGELEDEVRRLVAEAGVAERVHFLGVRDDVPDVLSAMDAFLFTSFSEGLSNAVVEAQTSGLPCVVSTGIPALAAIGPNITFLDLDEGDEAWAQRACELLASGSHGREDAYLDAVRSGFDIGESARWISEFYLDHAHGTR